MSVVVFTVEYFLRLWAVGEETSYGGVLGRLRFMITFYPLIDLASILPFYIDLGINGFGAEGDLRAVPQPPQVDHKELRFIVSRSLLR